MCIPCSRVQCTCEWIQNHRKKIQRTKTNRESLLHPWINQRKKTWITLQYLGLVITVPASTLAWTASPNIGITTSLSNLWLESQLLGLVQLPKCNSSQNIKEIESFSLKPFFYGLKSPARGLGEKLSNLNFPLHTKRKRNWMYFIFFIVQEKEWK
jgi:hypothetical protein